MTPDQVTLVQQSYAKVAPISEQAAVLFYARLFEVAPSVKPEKGLGEAWTPDVAGAWTAAYGTPSGFMISEAYGSSQAAE